MGFGKVAGGGGGAVESQRGSVTPQKSTKIFFWSMSNLKFKFPAKMSPAAAAAEKRKGKKCGY